MKHITLVSEKRENIYGNKVMADFRIPFWTRLRLLFCPRLQVTVPLNLPPAALPMEYTPCERVMFRVENRTPMKLVSEVSIPFSSQRYMSEEMCVKFAVGRMLEQFWQKIRPILKITTYGDPVQSATIVRGVIWVVDMRD